MRWRWAGCGSGALGKGRVAGVHCICAIGNPGLRGATLRRTVVSVCGGWVWRGEVVDGRYTGGRRASELVRSCAGGGEVALRDVGQRDLGGPTPPKVTRQAPSLSLRNPKFPKHSHPRRCSSRDQPSPRRRCTTELSALVRAAAAESSDTATSARNAYLDRQRSTAATSATLRDPEAHRKCQKCITRYELRDEKGRKALQKWKSKRCARNSVDCE